MFHLASYVRFIRLLIKLIYKETYHRQWQTSGGNEQPAVVLLQKKHYFRVFFFFFLLELSISHPLDMT